MSETTNPDLSFLDELSASLWAIMPEEMANTVAGVKRDLLTSLRSTIDSMVDHDLACLDRNLANARRKREEWKQKAAPPEAEAI
ncbi:MAG TPA: hypothetical protein VFZ34_10245 [Blastocatellia bacterium]|nr:hypothetical protein [Blastocatellia bacterium]